MFDIISRTCLLAVAAFGVYVLLKTEVQKIKRRYNRQKDTPDTRDFKFTYTATQLPASVDLRPLMSPVVDQLQIGSCTANALAGALGFLELKEQAAGDQNDPEEFGGSNFTAFSRLFIYWNERVIEGDTSQDNGAQLRDGIKSLASVGTCSENLWMYNPSIAFETPMADCFTQAANHKITSYQSLDNRDITALKTCLASGFPFVFGFTVFSSFESAEVAATGIVPMPQPYDQEQGGHAVLCVGFRNDIQAFIVRNSWSDKWGDKGYCYMPYSYLTNPSLASDFWVLFR